MNWRTSWAIVIPMVLGCSSGEETPGMAAGGSGGEGASSDGGTSSGGSGGAGAGALGGAGNDGAVGGEGAAGGMAGAGGEGGAGGDTTDDTLSNVSLPCAVSGFTNAVLPDEIDHRYGIVLTPTSYPFTVETVRYSLRHDDQFCDASFAHEVDILRTSTVPPSATPSTSGQLVESHTISASAPLLETVVALSLDAPLELSAGESLVVSIQMVANGAEDRTLCLNTCYDQALTGKDLWSNTAVEPYDWADLVSDYDILANATVSAY